MFYTTEKNDHGLPHDPFKAINVPQWRRQWMLWRAARRPALMFG